MTALRRILIGALLGLVPAVAAFAQTPAIRLLPLRVSALVAEPVSARLYAALPGDAGAGANSVVAIDPVAGTVGPPLFVGSEPHLLAPSDDGRFLYVGLGGASALRRIDLGAGVVDAPWPLIVSGPRQEPATARALATVPGAPSTVVVVQSAMFSSAGFEIVAYDDGVPRPVRVRETVESIVAIDGATFVANTSQALLRLHLDAAGLTVTARRTPQLGAPRVQDVAAGLVFAEGGYVYDAATLHVVRRQQSPSSYTVRQRVAPSARRTYRLARGRLIAHDLETFDILETVALPLASGMPQSLVALRSGVAYHTNLPAVVLVGDFAAAAPAVPPSAVSARLELSGCVECRVGMAFQAAVTFASTAPGAVTVEVKAGIRTPTGVVLPTILGGPHTLMDVAPGERSIVILAGAVPPGSEGEWLIDLTLVDPVSGRTLSSSTRQIRVTPF